jgi:hypothetical protein
MSEPAYKVAGETFQNFSVGDVVTLPSGEHEVVNKRSDSVTQKWVSVAPVDGSEDAEAWRAEDLARAVARPMVDDVAAEAVGMALDNASDMGLYGADAEHHVGVCIEGYVSAAVDMAEDRVSQARFGEIEDDVVRAAREHAFEECGITTYVEWPGHSEGE